MILNLFIVFLIGLFSGYKWGFNNGKEEGVKIARAKVPLFILAESLEKGYCLICSKNVEF